VVDATGRRGRVPVEEAYRSGRVGREPPRAGGAVVTESRLLDIRVAMGGLFGLVITFLITIGVLHVVLHGDTGTFFRYLGIGLLLSAFGVGFYRKWARDRETE
jgi:hypothetical protein